MKIDTGSVIKIICKGNIIENGVVIEYNKDQMVLELIDKSLLIILNPQENIIAIKMSKQETESSPRDRVFVDTELKPHRYERREDLRAASLAELHKMRANAERQKARELMNSFEPNKLPEVSFGYPSLKSLPKHTKKKT
jgi:hypothetical protein